jgi:biopolymer transport protein ExbD
MIPPLDEIEVEKIHARSKGRKRDEREVNVDMNPMVDLAFLLLTFFMLATTFSRPQAMELLVPAKAKDETIEKEMPVKESKTLSLVLLEKKIIWYNGITDPETQEISYGTEELKVLVDQQQASIDGLVVFIKPDSSNDFGELVEVLDIMKLSNVQRYALAPLSDFDQTLVKEETTISND